MAFRNDTSSETRELEEIIRELGELLPSDFQIDGKESRSRCADALEKLRKRSSKSEKLVDAVQGIKYEKVGDEHKILKYDADTTRVYKVTYGENFGCFPRFSIHDPELKWQHFYGSTQANPFFYLQRWILLNRISGFKTRFEGILPPEEGGVLPQICISQPVLPVENPSLKQVRAAFAARDFHEICDGAFLHFPSRLLLTDAAPRNVRIDEGNPIPFDAIALIAPPKVFNWALKQTGG